MKKVLVLIITLITTLSAYPQQTADGSRSSFFTASDLLLLDSLHQIAQDYEHAGNYKAAYDSELLYLNTRNKIKKQRLSSMVEKRLKDSKNNSINIANMELRKQNAQIELDMLESEAQTIRTRFKKDSIDLENYKLARDNWMSSNELQREHLKHEQEEKERLVEQRKMRLLVLVGIIVLAVIIILMSIIHIKKMSRDYRILTREKKVVDRALKEAQEAEQAHDRFMHNLSDEIREPLEALVRAADDNVNNNGDLSRREDNMMKIHINTDRLIRVVDNIIDKVEVAAGEKIMMLTILFSCFAMTAHSQNNSYGLRDDIYEYYLKCDRSVRKPEAAAMCDTLIMIAHREKNKKLECMAYDVLVGNAFFSNDINKIHKAQKEAIAFIRTTKYTDYIFYIWNRSLIWYIGRLDFVNAGLETRAYQKEALRLNNYYGITKGYYYMGEIYRQRGMNKEAVEQYQKAVEQAWNDTEQKVEISSSYCRIGEIYLSEAEYDKAEAALKGAIKVKIHEYELVNPTLQLFRLYVLKGDVVNAENMKASLEKMDAENLIYGSRRTHYMSSLVRYYILKGDNDRAKSYMAYADNSDYESNAITYAMLGDYKSAMETLHNGLENAKKEDATMDLARLTALQSDIDYNISEMQNSKLALENTLLSVEHQKKQNELIHLKNVQDSVELHHNKLQNKLRAKNDSVIAASRSVMEETMMRQELELKSKRDMALIIGCIVFVVLLSVVIDTIRRRYIAVKLEREKAEVVKACQLAEEAVERKRLFLEQVTHEIRTPLNAVVGFNQILCDENIASSLSEDDLKNITEQSNKGAEALNRMVGVALELSDIDCGKIVVNKGEVDVNSLCNTLVYRYSSKAQKGVSLSLQGEKVPMLKTDATKLERALSMLLDNAVKFTKSGSVKVGLLVEKELLQISVTDTGCGVPVDRAEDIFENFSKVDSFIPGIGLGLPLCRALIHKLGGEVGLDASYTGGARFVVKLVYS